MTAERILREGLPALGAPADGARVALLLRYLDLLETGNRVMNLTAITDPLEAARLHILDSAALLGAADLRAARVVDVGTGAGLPGVPLRILEPSLRLTLLDSLGKRVDFLRASCAELALEGTDCVHARAEEFAREPAARDGYDVAVSRAVADLRLLAELCLPLVRPGGRFLAMKAADCGAELAAAGRAVTLLGGRLLPCFDYRIPGTDILRRVVVVEKTGPTPEKYPRRFAKMQKQPL